MGEGDYVAKLVNFTAIIKRDVKWFIAYCPEIPGANGQGKSKEEALDSLAQAIGLVREDRGEDGLRGTCRMRFVKRSGLSETQQLTVARLEALRDRTFRRTPARRIRGATSALRFINDVGFSLTLSDFGLPLPSLRVAAEGRRNPRWPRRTHHDPAIILAWNLKDELPAKRLCYYGRVVRGKPTLVSLVQFANVFALVRGDKGSGDYLVDYRNGELSRAAFRILDALHEHGMQYTPDLRRRAGLAAAEATGTFERAMAELQRRLWVVKTEERYDPSFSYRWDLLDDWMPDEAKRARDITRQDAAYGILRGYLAAAFYTTPRLAASLFGLPPDATATAVERLVQEGRAAAEQRIAGAPGHWLVARSALDG